jgi:hypothetical protein
MSYRPRPVGEAISGTGLANRHLGPLQIGGPKAVAGINGTTIKRSGITDFAAAYSSAKPNPVANSAGPAKPGQILISARVLTKVEHAVNVEPVGEFELKD